MTSGTSYVFRITAHGHLEHIHYGERLPDQPFDAMALKRDIPVGSSIVYDAADPLYSLDSLTLEWSGIGKGDYRHAPAEIRMPDGTYVTDFVYQSHRVLNGPVPMSQLPSAQGSEADCQTLEITLREAIMPVTLTLYYTAYEAADVITRRAVLSNQDERPLTIRKLMSLMLDMPNRNFTKISFRGGWIKEAHRQDQRLAYGLSVQESTTGSSSNRFNPGFFLAEQGATEQNGRVYGFNLIYSGNHYEAVELSNDDLVRVMTGLNPHCFEWPLAQGERFETPEAVMTFSDRGFNGASHHFHDFIQRHIIRGEWQDKDRPVLINSWEPFFLNFNQRRLLRLARQARKFGIELFVLDDGWFGHRDNDRTSLGDYSVNRKKLRGGLPQLVRKINRLGLQFGLWFEPEMVNPDSDLYRAHPEYAVRAPGREPALGRNQLVLDLCRPEVRDHIVKAMGEVLDSAPIAYVKWDMNRHISDFHSPGLANQGEFFHRYILGLYDILDRIFRARPHILLESCSSGGNRFDLGMLCYSPQIWTSDNTDPIERLAIQGGLTYLYPPSTMGAHVSNAPHQQTLRPTPLSTRFNVASFGCLGYELDPRFLSPIEKREIRRQVADYKRYRRTLQFGRFYRLDPHKDNKVHFQAMAPDGRESVAGFFQTLAHAGEGPDRLPLTGLDPDAQYVVETRPQMLPIRRFGHLVNHILPFPIHPEWFLFRLVNRFFSLTDCVETFTGSGRLLMAGVPLHQQFLGTGYNNRIRMLGDFGSNLYWITKLP